MFVCTSDIQLSIFGFILQTNSALVLDFSATLLSRLYSYLSDEEALLHVSRLYGSEKLHGFVLALTGLQLLTAPQHAL